MKYPKETETYLLSLLICLITASTNCLQQHEGISKENLSADALQSYLTQLMSKDAFAWTCPAPKFPATDKDCSAPTCKEEETCPLKDEVCCFNGCVFTCVKKLDPPPVIDWEVKPNPEDVSGNEGADEVRYCSISPLPAPSKPVGCPDGFICQVKIKATGPRGICVPTTSGMLKKVGDTELFSTCGIESHSPDETSVLQENKAKETVYLPGGCVLSQAQYEDMKEFEKKPYVINCFCARGSVECQLDSSEKFQDKEKYFENPDLESKENANE